jgi:MHS family proline/betaine transporter-like MFS transporter
VAEHETVSRWLRDPNSGQIGRFRWRARSTAVSLVYGIAVVLVGGFAPLIVTWLIAVTGSPIAPAIYVIGAAAVSGVTLLGLHDRFREPLR